jgi:hypothetical protein
MEELDRVTGIAHIFAMIQTQILTANAIGAVGIF